MDIAALSMAMSQSQLMSQVNMGVLKMSMDTSESMGDNMVKMMEQSVSPNLGQSIDITL